MGGVRAALIYLDSCVLLSKKPYQNWREIQEEYWNCYRSSLAPMTLEEILCFFQDDFGAETRWPFSRSELIHFFESGPEAMRSGENAPDGAV